MSPLAENHEGPLLLEVERFEHVPAGPERVLLRIDGRYGERPGKRVLEAMLFVDDGLAVHRHAPLGDDADEVDSWLWRAAFDVPAAYLTDERTRFALESEPGCLIDLPRPGEIVTSSAVSISARAAHLARRYAGAIAVLLTVAVAPGGLPAMARTEILRVHNPDGSVVYMTSDGQTLSEIPADAVVVDQSAPAAPAAAAPAATQQAAPATQAQPQPATQPQPAPPVQPDTQNKGTWNQKNTNGADALPAGGTATRPAANSGSGRAPAPAPKSRPRHLAPQTPAAQQAAGAPAAAPKKQKPRKRHHAHHQVPQTHAQVGVQGAPPASAEQLQSLPALLVAPGSDDAKLRSLNRVGGNSTQAPNSDPKLPTKDLQNMGDLVGGPAHGPATGPPVTTVPIPTTDTAPPLVPLGTGDKPQTTGNAPQTTGGQPQPHTGDNRPAPKPPKPKPEPAKHTSGGAKAPAAPAPAPGPAPATPSVPGLPNGGFFNTLPGPASAVPDFVISKFRVPPFLLPIYQAAGIQYGIRWEVLAAINEIETDYGRNLNVSSAGALGWMQFMPSTWQMYGVDANKDGQKDPYNPVDAIFAAARYLKAAGGDKDIRTAIFAYNHAGWYVDSVMLRAKLIAGYPADLISSLTGLTEGHFPVAAHARYANGAQPAAAAATNPRRGIDIFTQAGAPVVAVNDGVIKKIGYSKKKGHFVVLQDVYGNQYTYSNLASVAQLYPVPKQDAAATHAAHAKAVGANDPAPKHAASAGGQRVTAPAPGPSSRRTVRPVKPPKKAAAAPAPAPIVAVKQRLFAHPQRPIPQKHGGFNQILDMQAGKGFETYDSYFSHPLGLNSRNSRLRRLKVGAHVLASTVLGRVADRSQGSAPHLYFEIRPAGQGAPKIDPKPILDGWKLLESTAIFRAKGQTALTDGNYSIGEAMLLPKPLLAKRVLSDPRINIYPAGRQDIKTGQIDRRVLVVLEYLAESGLNPTVSCLKSGHNLMTTSGNVSEHSSGNAVDISAVNGVPILGHQGPGDVAEQTVRRLMMLQGTMQPHQIISLLSLGGNTMAMGDHANHIHVGFHPLFGANAQLGKEALSVLQPGQWDNLVQRIGQIDNPTVLTKPSRWSIPVPKGKR